MATPNSQDNSHHWLHCPYSGRVWSSDSRRPRCKLPYFENTKTNQPKGGKTMRIITPHWTSRSLTSNLFDEMDQFFQYWDQGVVSDSKVYDERSFSPSCEVSENDDSYLMSFDLPGMKKEDIKIELSKNLLTISGERKRDHLDKNHKVQRYERTFGFFKRSFTLPDTVEVDNVVARYENGVLDLAMPKTQAAKPRQIEIQTGKNGFFDRLLGTKKTNEELKDVTSTKTS